MAYRITKILRGKRVNYWVESYRPKGSKHPKRRTLAYLGEDKTPAARLKTLRLNLRSRRKQIASEKKLIEFPSWDAMSPSRRLRRVEGLVRQVRKVESSIVRLSYLL